MQKAQNTSKSDQNLLLGIDTGGTYTDSVLLNYETHDVLSSAKILTTYDDLARGVAKSVEQLNIQEPQAVKLVGISSTLATNSVGEGKMRKTGLILVGYDRDLVNNYRLEENFSAHTVGYFNGGHNQQGEEQEALDLDSVRKWVEEHKDEVEALAVSSYFSPLNTSHENRIEEMVAEICDLPVVLGHQLSTKLDSIKRASTACLNASLVAVMHEFIEAVHRALETRNIQAPLMVVKGDGSLIPHTVAAHRPVETVLSGPAASTIGGKFLSGERNALVIDMGGTTTDIALLEEGRVAIADEGPSVGPVKTAVKAAKIRTAVVGCDSKISAGTDNDIAIGPERVVPLSRLASDFPEVLEDLQNRDKKRSYVWKSSDLVYWFLHSEFTKEQRDLLSETQQKVVDCISGGPRCLSRILSSAGVHHEVQLNPAELFANGRIGVATLTPTDLLHVDGEMDKWCQETAGIAVKRLASVFSMEQQDFVDTCLEKVVRNIVEEYIVFLAREKHANLPESIDGEWGNWLFHECLYKESDLLAVSITSRIPVIGIGAPARYFIRRATEALNSKFIVADYAEVANAVGAVVGMTIAEEEAIVHVRETGDTLNYVVQADGKNVSFQEEDEAYEHARKIVRELSDKKCRDSGVAEPQVTVSEVSEGHLKRIIGRAAGNLALS